MINRKEKKQRSIHISATKRQAISKALSRSIKTLIAIIVLTGVTAIFSACKKSDLKKATCHIATINFPAQNLAYHLLYNNEGKLDKLSSGEAVITYAYAGNTTTVTTFDSGRFVNKTIAILNSSGLAINVRTENNASGTDWANATYEYSGTELAKYTYTSSATADTVTTTYTWLNHNMSKIVNSTNTDFDYYSDKLSQNGDYFSLTQLVQGYETVRNKNLVKLANGQHLTYQFGSNGISSLTTTSGGGSAVIDYEYECK